MKEFGIQDMAVAAVLRNVGFSILKINKIGNKGTFVFEDTEDLHETVKDYYNGNLTVCPKAYFEDIRSVKAQLYSS